MNQSCGISCSCVQGSDTLFPRPLGQVGHGVLVSYLFLATEAESRVSVVDGLSGD